MSPVAERSPRKSWNLEKTWFLQLIVRWFFRKTDFTTRFAISKNGRNALGFGQKHFEKNFFLRKTDFSNPQRFSIFAITFFFVKMILQIFAQKCRRKSQLHVEWSIRSVGGSPRGHLYVRTPQKSVYSCFPPKEADFRIRETTLASAEIIADNESDLNFSNF